MTMEMAPSVTVGQFMMAERTSSSLDDVMAESAKKLTREKNRHINEKKPSMTARQPPAMA